MTCQTKSARLPSRRHRFNLLRLEDRTVPATLLALENGLSLVRFDSATPGTVTAGTPITGLGAGELMDGIDVRPATGQVYGLAVSGTTARIGTLDIDSGAFTQVGATFTIAAGSLGFGFDFNPTVDRIRFTSTSKENLVINPNDGSVTIQTDLNPGSPLVVGSAYTNSFPLATSTVLYDIDASTSKLMIQNPPAGGTLTVVGDLGVATNGMVGFDITGDGKAFATLTSGLTSSLYTINLSTGAATLVGQIGSNPTLISGMTALHFVWDGGGADDKWTTAANWVGDVAPSGGDDLVFPSGAAQLSNTNDFLVGTTFNSITFTGGGYNVQETSPGANSVQLNHGLSVTATTNGSIDFGPGVILTNPQTFANTGSVVFRVDGIVNFNGNALTVNASGANINLNGKISGSGSLTSIGSKTLFLEGSGSDYTGPTFVNAGTLDARDSTALGATGGAVNEVQTITIGGSTSGAFTLTFNGQTTSTPLSATATAAEVQAALEALSSIGTGNVAVTQTGNVYTVTFGGSLAAQDLPPIAASGIGGTTVTVDVVTEGSNNTTTVAAGATLVNILSSVNVGETLTLSGSGVGGIGALVSSGADAIYSGPIFLNGPATINVSSSSGQVTFSGVVADGPVVGSLVKIGPGTLTLAGSSSNTYAGTTTVNEGTLLLAMTGGAQAFGGSLVIGDGTGGASADVVRESTSNNIPDTSDVTIKNSGLLTFNAGVLDAVNKVNMTGSTIDTGTGKITVNNFLTGISDAAGVASTIKGNLELAFGKILSDKGGGPVDLQISAVISGSNGLLKLGGGVTLLNGTTSNTYTGTTELNAGTLLLNATAGTNALPGPVMTTGSSMLSLLNDNQIADGATLTLNSGFVLLNGHSEKVASTTLTGLGILDIGLGTLTTGDFTANAAPTVRIAFTGAGTSGHIVAGGKVSFANAVFLTLDGTPPPLGKSLTIVDNTGSNPVSGTFFSLAEGQVIDFAGTPMLISYKGGTGNDIVLTAGVPPIFTSPSRLVVDKNQQFTFHVTTNGAPPASVLISGGLPSGVTYTNNNDGTGTLSGKTSESGTFGLNFLANNGTGTTAIQLFTLVVVEKLYAVGAGPGGSPQVNVYGLDGKQHFTFQAYDQRFAGGVTVATADFNNDGVDDIITGAASNGGPHVKIFDGKNLNQLASFFAYSASFTGGIFVAAGDVNGDGQVDIITGANAGGGSHVKVFNGLNLSEMKSFFAYNAAFKGGVRVAAGDVNKDGKADIITGAGPGGGPHVQAFSGADLKLLLSFYAYDPGFAGGVFVASGDLNGDGFADVITGAGAGGGPQVQAFDGRGAAPLQSFFAYSPAFTGGVAVAAKDIDGDGKADFLTGAGPGGGPQVRAVKSGNLAQLQSFYAFDPAFMGGVFVG